VCFDWSFHEPTLASTGLGHRGQVFDGEDRLRRDRSAIVSPGGSSVLSLRGQLLGCFRRVLLAEYIRTRRR
jgi:hypothetical protein